MLKKLYLARSSCRSSALVKLLDRSSFLSDPLYQNNILSRFVFGQAPVDVPLTSTEQPRGLSCFDWRDFPSPPNPPISTHLRREPFSSQELMLVRQLQGSTRIEYLLKFGIGQLWNILPKKQKICAAGGIPGTQMFASNSLQPNSRISRWYDTTPDKLCLFRLDSRDGDCGKVAYRGVLEFQP